MLRARVRGKRDRESERTRITNTIGASPAGAALPACEAFSAAYSVPSSRSRKSDVILHARSARRGS
jgi:hypothetical protein